MHRSWFVTVITLGALCTGSALAEPVPPPGGDIALGQPVSGSINDAAPQVAYRMTARAGDVINAAITTTSRGQVSQSAGKSLQELDSHVTILDAAGKELASSLPGHRKETFFWNTHSEVFAVIPTDDSYTVLAERSPGSHLTGNFELTVTQLAALKVGDAVRKTLTVQDVERREFGTAYAVQSDSDFFLTYRKTGPFSPTLYVSVIAGRDPANLASLGNRLQTVAAIAGPKNGFTTLNDSSAFKGGRLLIAGRKEPYVVTLYNKSEFDTTYFLHGVPNASANCEVMITEAGRRF